MLDTSWKRKMNLPREKELLLDYFRHVNVSSTEEAENVYKEILASCGRTDDCPNLSSTIDSINALIKNYDLEIVEGVDENSSGKIYCLIKTNSNSLTQKAKFYDKQTYELLSLIIREIVTSDEDYLSEISCLNMSTNVRSSKSNLQASLERLIQDKWLEAKNGKVTIGNRSRLELEVAIKNTYPDYAKHCRGCKAFFIKGFTCTECGNQAHFHCLKKLFKMKNSKHSKTWCCNCKNRMTENMSEESSVTHEPGSEMEPPAKRAHLESRFS